MARIFISHSSVNNPQAVALRDWLVTEGWDDLFLDLDPERGIAAGERWERSLNESAYRCEAVLFLVSQAWLTSAWCMKEFRLATKLNKRIFGLLVEEVAITNLPAELRDTWQLVDLTSGNDHQIFRAALPDGSEAHVTYSKAGLARVKGGLTKAGLDAHFFAWPPDDEPDRPPYRGLQPLEFEDAGIFFGREAPTIETLDRLRGLSQGAPPRFLVILGASGAGKSSFLRAGLLPRLKRDDRAFLPLPIVRPERAAISGETGMLRSLETAFKTAGLKRTRAEIKAALDAGAPAVASLLEALATAAEIPALDGEVRKARPRLILSIDQGEELFLSEGTAEARAFLELIRDLTIATDANLIVIFTIRSDAYEYLQSAPALDGVKQHTLSLPPLPRGAYQTVIEGPAERLRDTTHRLTIEPALTAALLVDIEAGGAKDALPLLSFTLERLYIEHGGDSDLKLTEYREIGGIKGAIEAAVEQALAAADVDAALPKRRAAMLALLRQAMIPWLAGIDHETGAPRRRIALLSNIPEKARPLLEHMITARLLTTDVSPETGERTVEPAHEALLRQWSQLKIWLDEDFSALAARDAVQRAARAWNTASRDEGLLVHTAGRLDTAEALLARDNFAHSLGPIDRAYLAAARAADIASRDRELEEARKLATAQKEAADRAAQVTKRTRQGLIASIVLGSISIGAAIYGLYQAREAGFQATEAARQSEEAKRQKVAAEIKSAEAVRNESIGLAALSGIALQEGYPADALQLALAAWPREDDADRPKLIESVRALAAALPYHHQRAVLRHPDEGGFGSFSANGTHVITAGEQGSLFVWDVATKRLLTNIDPGIEDIFGYEYFPDEQRILTRSSGQNLKIWNLETGDALKSWDASGSILSTEIFPDGDRLLIRLDDGIALVQAMQTGDILLEIEKTSGGVRLSPDGTYIVAMTWSGVPRVLNAGDGEEIAIIKGVGQGSLRSFFISPDSKHLGTISLSGNLQIWNPITGEKTADISYGEKIISAEFSASGDRLVTVAENVGTVRVWNAATSVGVAELSGHTENVRSAVFSKNGAHILTASDDWTARLWSATTGVELLKLEGHTAPVTRARFSPDGNIAMTAAADGTNRLWDIATGTKATVLGEYNDTTVPMAFSPDGLLAAIRVGDTLRILNVESGAVILTRESRGYDATFSNDGKRFFYTGPDGINLLDTNSWDDIAVLNHGEYLTSTAFSPSASYVVTADNYGAARLWSATTGREVARFEGHLDAVVGVAVSHDDKLVATVSLDKTTRLWDSASADTIAILDRHGGYGGSVSFSADGGRLMTSTSSPARVRILDTKDNELVNVLNVPDDYSRARLSSDGTLVITYSQDRVLARIWDTETGEEVQLLKGHNDGITSAVFYNDALGAMTASYDGTVRIWDMQTGATIHTFFVGATVRDAVLSADGSRVLSVSEDERALIWNVPPLGSAFEVACERLGNETDLTRARSRYGLGDLSPICGPHKPFLVSGEPLECPSGCAGTGRPVRPGKPGHIPIVKSRL